MTDENCQFLQQRVKNNLSLSVQTVFEKNLQIYLICAAVYIYNFAALQKCKCFVLQIQTKHQSSAVKNSSEENTQRLSSELLLSKDCQLMIIYNFVTVFRLINETLSTLYNII